MTDRMARKRKPSLRNALSQSYKAGAIPTSATMKPDGTVVIGFGKRGDIEPDKTSDNKINPWDEVLDHERH